MEKVVIVWGEDDSKRAVDRKWSKLENGPVTYSFSTAAEKYAFLRGVNEAIGWMECQELIGSDLASYLKSAKRRRAK